MSGGCGSGGSGSGSGNGCGSGGGSGFIPTRNGSGYGYQPIENLKGGGQIRDTIQFDKDGNVLDGHTTVEIPGGLKIPLPWKEKQS